MSLYVRGDHYATKYVHFKFCTALYHRSKQKRLLVPQCGQIIKQPVDIAHEYIRLSRQA